jgi:choline dehydrogenase-like flavoprotein
MDSYDVIIVGTGAGGGTLARHLAPSGKRILLLERGDWLPREPSNWLAQDVFVDNRYISEDTWYDEKRKSFQPQVHAVNPALTAMANSLRVGDHLLERLDAPSRVTAAV